MIAIGKGKLGNGELLVLDLVDGKFTNKGMIRSVGTPAMELSIWDVQDSPDWTVLNADLYSQQSAAPLMRLRPNPRDDYSWFFNPRHCGRTTTSNTTQLPTSDPYTTIRSTVDKLDVLFTIVEVTDSGNVESKMRAKVDYLEYKKGYIKIAGLQGKISILVVNDALIWEAK